MSFEILTLLDTLRKRQNLKLHELRKIPDGKKLRLQKELEKEVVRLGYQQNTLWHVLEELQRVGINNPVINVEGLCYGCHEAISDGIVIVYKSQRNGTISLFHEACWQKVTPIGPSPLLKMEILK